MTVKDLLFVTGGSVKYRIELYDKWSILTSGIVDDIVDFNNIPYGEYEVQHISIDNDKLVINIIGINLRME